MTSLSNQVTEVYLINCMIAQSRNQYYSISIKSITYNSQISFLYEIFNTSMKKEIEEQHKLINHENSYHELLRNLAHEIKNPLGAMKGSAQLLERKTDFPLS